MIRIDPGFQALVPPLTAEELAQLEANILADGCRDPLVVWNGIIVDGHNRYAICSRHRTPFKTVETDFASRSHAEEWIIRNQFGRRNLTAYVRTKLALQLEETIAARAKANQVASLKQGTSVPQISAKRESIDTRQELAKVAGVSHDTVAKVKKIEQKATPEIRAKLETGEMSINQAYKEVDNKEKLAKKAEKFIQESVEASGGDAIIRHACCMAIINDIEPIDLLIADPPYFTDGDYTKHVSEYLRKVKPTGQAYVFLGADPCELRAYLGIDSGELSLEQLLVWNYNNTGQRQPNARYNSNYQLCLYYRGPNAKGINKPADGKEQYACQTVNAPDGRQGDRLHQWQKPDELISRLIRNSSDVGDFVFDPFACTGTTMLMAARLGRKTLGCEIDESVVRIAETRGCRRAV